MSDNYFFYEILNICEPEKYDDSLISENFKKLSLANHPDLITGDKKNIVERFYFLCFAYLVLSDKKLKEIYDNQLSAKSINSDDTQFFSDNLEKISLIARGYAQSKYKEFVNILRDDIKLISELNAQTSLGLYYDYLDFCEDQRSYEFYIDPEDIRPKISLFKEIMFTYLKIIGICIIIYFSFYITAYIRM